MTEFSFDTSGAIEAQNPINRGIVRYEWRHLSPFVQGYARGVAQSLIEQMRVVPEREDDDIAKEGETPHHWTVFPSGDDWTPLGKFDTEAEARAFVASFARFDRFDPSALALILRDCEACGRGRGEGTAKTGAAFWKLRQAGVYPSEFPPLQPYLSDEGKVCLREAA